MAIDVVHVCSTSVENDSSQLLATVLSIFFLLYTGITILLAGFQIWSVSNQPHVGGSASATSKQRDIPLMPPAR